jgi:hypothetical protein
MLFAQCLQDWDAATHMTKREWSAACHLLVQRGEYLAEPSGSHDSSTGPIATGRDGIEPAELSCCRPLDAFN